MTTVAIATVETSHYSFLAVGHDTDHARDVLMSMWHQHARRTGADHDHVRPEDVNVLTASTGDAFLDRERFGYHNVTTWADGYGRWHAYVTVPNVGSIPAEMNGVARDAIADQIIAREESPVRTAAELRKHVNVELIDKGRDENRAIRFHYAEAL